MSSSSTRPRQGHVWLILYKSDPNNFLLEVPREVIINNSTKPLKYLRYLGWCVLGREGILEDEKERVVDLSGGLNARKYFYRLEDDAHIFEYAVDIEVIKQRTGVPSESSATRDNFRDILSARDPRCVFTGVVHDGCSAAHIIPFSRGDEWLKLIINNRPHGNETFKNWKGINDRRNGLTLNTNVHTFFDRRAVLVLKTPNPMLTMEDVPPRHERLVESILEYPPACRYTLQWVYFHAPTLVTIPNNSDGAFSTKSRAPGPSDLLLHYNYGAAAVKHWGKNIDVLLNNANFPRPEIPEPGAQGPAKKKFDRDNFRRKLDGKRAEASGSGGGGAVVPGGPSDSQGGKWDEDDVMLFLWGNTQAARERRASEENKKKQGILSWRSSIEA